MRHWIYGAGAQGRMALDILRAAGCEDAAFVDDSPELRGQSVLGAPVHGADALAAGATVVVAIGKPTTRLALAKKLADRGVVFFNAVHPAATLLPSARIGVGNVIGPQSVIDTEARLGDHCILNPKVLVGHDSRVGSGVTFAGGVALGSRVTVGDGAFLCMCCDVVPRVNVGAGAVIGAGALVMKDVPERVLAAGSPARPVWPVDDKFDWAKVL